MPALPGPFDDGELRDAAASMRAEWRADEEEWTRAALERWEHDRTLLDVLRDAMHRGDTLAIAFADRTFTGRVSALGHDWCCILGRGGAVDVHLAGGAALVVRVVEAARAGGRRGDVDPRSTFRARLLGHEAQGAEWELGVVAAGETLRGTLRVGRDHVAVRSGDGAVSYASLGAVAWVRAAGDA